MKKNSFFYHSLVYFNMTPLDIESAYSIKIVFFLNNTDVLDCARCWSMNFSTFWWFNGLVCKQISNISKIHGENLTSFKIDSRLTFEMSLQQLLIFLLCPSISTHFRIFQHVEALPKWSDQVNKLCCIVCVIISKYLREEEWTLYLKMSHYLVFKKQCGIKEKLFFNFRKITPSLYD